MHICHAHNLAKELPEQRRYGIRMRLPDGDTFGKILGEEWERYHWYATAAERDRAYEEFGRRHMYSRIGDLPTLVLEKVERETDDDASRHFSRG